MKSTDTKERILCEALRLFSRKGYDAVSVTDIAEAVGIKAPSLYNHYKSKRDIFDSILSRVSDMDAVWAKNCQMPEKPVQEDAEAYKNVTFDKICKYTKEMFFRWTEEEFSSAFRKLLTLEQYKNPEMSRLHRQYISGGPLSYMTDIFMYYKGSRAEAAQTALDFYGPIYLLYGIYDETSDKAAVLNMLERHLKNFEKNRRL